MLTQKKVNSAATPGRYSDGRGTGLWLQVRSATNKSYLFRYTYAGKERNLGLGPTSIVTLEEARAKCVALRKMLLDGRDPLEEKRQATNQAKAAITVAEAIERYITAHSAAWKGRKATYEFRRLATAAAGDLLNRKVKDLKRSDVLASLRPRWKPELADGLSRGRNRLERAVEMAIAEQELPMVNPFKMELLRSSLPKVADIHKGKNHSSMDWRDVPAFLKKLQAEPTVNARAVEMVVLTAARSGEIRTALHSDIDLKAMTLTIPAERMKAGNDHVIPLTEAMLDVIRRTPRMNGNPYIFPGRGKKPLGHYALRQLTVRLGVTETIHGFRSSFMNFAAENTDFSFEVREMCLAHSVGNAVTQAYLRTNLLEKRRELMQVWCDFATGYAEPARAKVLPLKRRKV